jgi:hypothetical protein
VTGFDEVLAIFLNGFQYHGFVLAMRDERGQVNRMGAAGVIELELSGLLVKRSKVCRRKTRIRLRLLGLCWTNTIQFQKPCRGSQKADEKSSQKELTLNQ